MAVNEAVRPVDRSIHHPLHLFQVRYVSSAMGEQDPSEDFLPNPDRRRGKKRSLPASTTMSQQRMASETLERDLWTWREDCIGRGKNISKRLVQARAKWAFQRQGFRDFKVHNMD